jgi:SagB-type dehydrogenase family enzyme
VPERPAAQGAAIALQSPGSGDGLQDDLGEVIIRRGSTRQFARVPISFAQLSTLLLAPLPGSASGVQADFLNPPGSSLVMPYLIVNAVEGLEVGSYVYRRETPGLERLKSGEFRALAGQLALGQDLAADASVNIYFLADLERVLNMYGNRGYRAAQLEAAVLAGRMYLAAYAQRLGATGLTFFDDAVIHFFSPQAEGMSVMFLLALGKKARRK